MKNMLVIISIDYRVIKFNMAAILGDYYVL